MGYRWWAKAEFDPRQAALEGGGLCSAIKNTVRLDIKGYNAILFCFRKVNPYLISLLPERKCRVVLAATVVKSVKGLTLFLTRNSGLCNCF